MTNVTLIEHPLSPYAQKVKIALLEKNIPFTTLAPMGASEEELQTLHASNPRGEVPVLLDGDLALYDSSIILEYIEDRWPESPLLPATPAERARVRTLEDVMDTHFEANTWGLAEIKIFRRATGEQATAITHFGETQIAEWFTWLNQQLGDRPYFNGQAFGWGDLSIVPFVNGANRFDLSPAPDSNLAHWLKQVNQRPSVIQAQTEAAAAELDPEIMTAAIAAGFKREYRDHRLEWMVRAGGINVVQAGLAADNVRFTEAFTTKS